VNNPIKFISGRLIKRYKRFFADVKLDSGEVVTAHCPNTGSMMGLLTEGNIVYLSETDNEKRKLKYTLEIIKVQDAYVGVNTHKANRIVEEGIVEKKISTLGKKYDFRREVKYGKNSRIDFLITNKKGEEIYLEVKNVTLSKRKGIAEFPDSVTERGSKHLLELIDVVKNKGRAIMLFLVQRDDCKKFRIAEEIDTTYKKNIMNAKQAGVEILCYNCSFVRNNIELDKKIKFIDK
jgi:sugar fermentation stimulation protein A